MAKTATTTPAKPEEKKKRTILTPEQRLAKMEADLKAEREKIQAKAQAKIKAQEELVAKLDTKVSEAINKHEAAKADLIALQRQAGVTTEDEPTPES